MKEIESIISAYEQCDWSKEQAVLGTLVQVEGSSYRRIGARIFVNSSGQWQGGISGGCLEGDALKEARKAMFFNRASLVVYDNLEDDPHQIGVGLGCNGRIEVLFKPIDKKDVNNPIEVLKNVLNTRQAQIVFQLIHAPKRMEHLMGHLYTQTTIDNLVKDMQAETDNSAKIMHHCKNIKRSTTFSFFNKNNEKLTILAEYIVPKTRLICVGDNYDVLPLIANANLLAWQTHIVGQPKKLNSKIMRMADTTTDISELPKLQVDAYTAVVIMSHDLKVDHQSLQHFIYQNPAYIGVLGPQKRFRKLRNLMTANDRLQLEQIDHKLYAPIGLDIGANSPEEIAHAICSEIIAHFRKRSGLNLKFREHAIHERKHILNI